MKIGLLLQDRSFKELDLSRPENGNMGIGGTQYCFIMLARYLNIHFPEITVYIYHYSNNKLPEGVVSVKISNEEEAVYRGQEDNLDILIIRNAINKKLSDAIKMSNVPVIVWAHNFPLPNELDLITTNDNIKRVVFVGKEQYDRYIDHPVIEKSTYIYNMFNSNKNQYNRIKDYGPNVCYVGSLVPAKGFHLVAAHWKKIIKEVPDAQLHVIGSGKLYNRDSKLGPYRIAEETYEKKIISYLSKDGNLLESVHFYGILGQEKFEVFNNTAVGIINPTGKTETFGMSAVEMESCGIPIVTIGKNGLLDTVRHRETGLLFKNKSGLSRNVVELLKDRELNDKLGQQAKNFVKQSFNPEKVVEDWYKLFIDIQNNTKIEYYKPINNFRNNIKVLRIINRKLKKVEALSGLPSIINIEVAIRNMITKFR